MQRKRKGKLNYVVLSILGLSLLGMLITSTLSSAQSAKRPVTAASSSSFFFSTGMPDGRIGTASRPAGAGVEIESADDFILNQTTTIKSATFYGLLPLGAPLSNINFVGVEIYRVFPLDSTDPPSGMVPTRVNSPSDNAFASRDSGTGNLGFDANILSASFTVANSVVNGINKSPNQHTGGEGPVTGEEVLFRIMFTTPLVLPTDHYFFKPEVGLTSGDFLWLSAPKPIVAPGTPFSPDLQSWIRNTPLDPDWLRIGTDIVGNTTFNAAFTLSSADCTITCPANVTQPNDQDQCGAVVNYPDPIADENCGSVECSPGSGTFFPVGTTTVTCMNTPMVLGPIRSPKDVTCNPQTVTESTTTTVLPNNSYTCDTGVSYWRAFDLSGSFGITNAFDVQSIDIGIESATSGNAQKPAFKGARISSTDKTGKVHAQGAGQPVTVRLYTDGGGFPGSARTQIASADFTIADQSLTVVNLPITATVPAGSELVVEVFAPNGQNPGNLFIYGSNTDPETAPSYVSAPNCEISDPTPTSDPSVNPDMHDMHFVMNVNGCEEIVSCSFTVTVQDKQNPTLTCPSNQVQCNDPNQCGAVVNYPAPTVNDNCPGGSSTCSPPSGSFFPVGTTTVTCNGMDAAGNPAPPCSFTVTVNDCQPPTINCLPAVNGAGGASCPIATSVPASFTVTATDNCPGTVNIVCTNQSGQVVTPGQSLPVGSTTITCTATDVAGNPSMCTFTVTEFSFCLQDDSLSGNVVLVNAQTGEYFFCCNGVPLASGIGTLVTHGCIGSIDHIKGDRKVHIQWDTSANNNTGAGTAFVQKTTSGKVICQITDKNMSNNNCQCSSPTPGAPTKPPKQKAQ